LTLSPFFQKQKYFFAYLGSYKTSTKTGLRVIVNLIDKVYDKGRQVMDGFKEHLPIIFDEYLPKWNYRAIPQNA